MKPSAVNDSFCKYGSVYYEPIDLEQQHLLCRQFSTAQKSVSQLFCFPCEVYVELISGLASIVVSAQEDCGEPSTFAIHHYLRLRPGTAFNILSRSDQTAYCIITTDRRFTSLELAEPFTLEVTPVRFNILEIMDYYFVAEEPGYRFSKASHHYYELLYVHSGTLTASIANTSCTLAAGDLILYGPDAEHPKLLIKDDACDYLSVVFDMELSEPPHLLGRVYHTTDGLREALLKLIEEAAVQSPQTKMLMLCHLQETITRLLQLCDSLDEERGLLRAGSPQTSQSDLLQQITSYMIEKVTEPITIEEICHKFFMSRSSLQALFKLYLHSSPKSYLLNIKLQKSKELIRENQHTISEIADMLGFSSIHYFSRLFKKYYDVSPSEYAKNAKEAAASESA